MKIRVLFVAALFTLSGPLAPAAALKCDLVFTPSVRDVLENLNLENNQVLFQGKDLDGFSENLSWLKKRKIRNLIENMDVRRIPSAPALERYAVELSTALFGSKETVDRWLFKSKEQRLEESTMMLLKEQLLKEGLLKTWKESFDPARINVFRRNLDRIKTFQSQGFGQLIRFPFILPVVKNSKISPQLMSKIVLDGYAAHAEEVRLALGKQNLIEAYNTFRKLYSPTYFGILLILSLQQAYEEMDRAMDEQVAQTVYELRQQRETLERAIPQLKQDILKSAYEQAVEAFIQKWGESPTPEEQVQLKAKIEKALNMN